MKAIRALRTMSSGKMHRKDKQYQSCFKRKERIKHNNSLSSRDLATVFLRIGM